MNLHRSYIFLKVMASVAVTVYLVVYTSYLYGDPTSYSRIYLPCQQNACRSHISQPANASEITNSFRPLRKSLPSIQTKHEPYFVSLTEESSSGEPFHSPFIKQKDEMTLGKVGMLKEQISAVRTNSTTKTFAIIWNCKGLKPGCFGNIEITVKNCPYTNCRQIKDLESSDVVVFYTWRMYSEEFIPKFQRPSHQLWVMWTAEAPNRQHNSANLDLPSLKGQFNWTMTHRLDSDIVDMYGRLERHTLPGKNYLQLVKGKKLPAAWFVSHCHTHSEREHYVNSMKTVLEIHIFGTCGTYNCSSKAGKRDLDTDECFPMLSKSYFFYLAFENSLCKDYITEKFFKIFQDVDVIPVVRGGADYKRYFPPNSFIDASDFKSPVELAKFLLHLSIDRERYLTMLIEKSRYRYVPPRNIFCDLCEKMVTDNNKKWYPDLRTWFVQDQCHEPTDLIK